MKLTISLFLYLFCLFASEAKEYHDDQDVPIDVLKWMTNRWDKKIVPLKEISSEPSPDEIIKIQLAGGDDVGSGGDELRKNILSIIHDDIKVKIKEGNSLYEYFNSIEIKDIIAVENLKIGSTPVMGLATDRAIVIDRNVFSKSLEISDIRYFLIVLILTKNDAINVHGKAVRLYERLDASSENVPFCERGQVLDYKLVEKIHNEEVVRPAENSSTIREEALDECKDEGYFECFVGKSGVKSNLFSENNSYAYYSGKTYEKEEKNGEEKREDNCLEIRRCLDVYFAAPKGQVEFHEFNSLQNEYFNQCPNSAR